jgi:uncharacterized membrane protein
MGTFKESIDVEVPVETAYQQFSRFEDFPRFMESVKSIERLDDERLAWKATICGYDLDWIARVTERVPSERLTWRSEGPLLGAGEATFAKLADARTRITLRIEYDPEAILRAMSYRLGSGPEQIRRDLECFKEITEDLASDRAA